MNNKIMARNRIIKILSIVTVAILAIALIVGIILLNKVQKPENNSYSIIVDDEITVYEGDTFTLVPYLVNKDGTVIESRFDYSTSDDAISINNEGVISVNSISKENAQISIYERNTSTSTEVNVNIISKLTKVLGITFSDLAGNKILVSGTQNLKIGETYNIDIVTEPRNVEIENYCLLHALNSIGIEKNVFEFSFTKTNVSMTVVGLGSGKLFLDIKNDNEQSIYNTNFDFNISMYDDFISKEVLDNANSTLLSKEELGKIERLELSQNITNLESLKNLQSLKTIVFTSDKVMDIDNITQDYCYRIRTKLFEDYLKSDNWGKYLDYIIPYEDNADEVFVVFHNTKTTTEEENIVYEKLEKLANFPVYIYEGYTNTGWFDADNKKVTRNQINTSTLKNGIHLYAGWEPISYKVVYHIRDSKIPKHEEIFHYDTEYLLKNPEDIDNSIVRTGYKTAGWTRNKNSSTISPNVQFRNGQPISNLTNEADAIIELYDLWEPIEYTIVFATVDGMEEIADITVKYNNSYTLPKPSKIGYEFKFWKLNNGRTLNAGEQKADLDSELNLSSIHGAEILLTPDFSEITYSIIFKLNGGHSPRDLTIVEGYKKSLRYTEYYKLPYLTKEGYTAYTWYCDSNGKTYGSEDSIVGEFTKKCEVVFTAIWTSAAYTVNFNCNGGNIDSKDFVAVNRYWDDGMPLLTPTRNGYTFVEWQDEEHNVSYAPENDGWTSNLIKSAAEDGVAINLKAKWQINYYNLTISTGKGTYLTVKVNDQTLPDGTHSVAYNSTITVNYGVNIGYSDAKCSYAGGNMPANKLSIFSSAKLTVYTITKENGSNGDKIAISYDQSNTYTYNSVVKFTLTMSKDYANGRYSIKYGNNELNSKNSGWQNNKITVEFTMPAADVKIAVSCDPKNSCFAKGTKLMLGDGTSVAVENLKNNDVILAFDHSTGQYVESRIIYSYFFYGYAPSVEVYFSNNISLEFLNGGHGLFNITLNKYVLINADNVQEFVGDEFLHTSYIDGIFVSKSIKLESYNISLKFEERYDIITENTLNHIANGLLACSDVLVGVCNMFEFDNDFTYDIIQMQEDIKTFGLYAYEEWSAYLSYEDFVAFNGAYFKIAIGKKLITVEGIFALLDDLSLNRS